MSDALLKLAGELRSKGCPEMALSLPDALWLARLLHGFPPDDDRSVTPRGRTVASEIELSQTVEVQHIVGQQPRTHEPASATPPPFRIETFEVEVPELRPDHLSVGMLVPHEHPGAQRAGRGPEIKIPAPPGLDDMHEFGRRLKPLRRFRHNRRKPLLDVARTVERICDEEIWDLVVKFPYDRCLHLTWIIDAGGSMDLWLQIARELFVACRDSGAFRSCHAYQWEMDQDWCQSFMPLDSRGRPGAAPVQTDWPATGGDRLVAIFSDCSAGRWYRKETRKELLAIGDQARLLVINPLPERMWGRTALGQGLEADLRSPSPAAPGGQLQVCRAEGQELPRGVDQSLKLPAVTTDPDQLLGWSRFVAGQRGVYPGFCLDIDGRSHARPAPTSEITAEQRLERFRRYASRSGIELARLMSAVPLLTPRFIRLVHTRMMVTDSAPVQTHEAEVLLSPLVRVVQEGDGDRERVYDFFPGVRERLLERTPREEVRKVFLQFVALEVLSDLPRRFSLGEYGAMIPRPDDPDSDCTVHPLSEAPTELILRRLGGKYRRFLEEARTSSLRLELNSHLRRAEEARAAGDRNAAFAAVDEARAFVTAEPKRWGQAERLLDEQLRFYRGLLRVPDLARSAMTGTEPFVETTTGMVLASIAAGEFLMGSPDTEPERYEDEGPRHRVTLSHDFWIGIHPVTQQQYEAVTGDDPSEFKGPNRPVEKVSWHDAVTFCEKLTECALSSGVLPDGYVFRLPTEAEWEYCCRAGTKTATAFGDSLGSDQANFNGEHPYGGGEVGPYLKQTSDVGSYATNDWGLYDMHGNVLEWCLDAADEDDGMVKTDTYVDGVVDPLCKVGRSRVNRGGAWDLTGGNCRSAYRPAYEPGVRYDFLGFRVCLARSPAGSEP